MSFRDHFRWWFNGRHQQDRFESEMDEELRFHVESQIEDGIKAGMSPDEARRTVFLAFGGMDKAKEECRDTRRTRILDDLSKDLRYGIRMLHGNPGFATVAIFTLALGIGATTAIFTVVNSVLLRPLPYAEPDRLVYVDERSERGNTLYAGGTEFIAWRKQCNTLSQIAGYFQTEANLTGVAEARRVTCGLVTQSFFPLLNVRPALGRTFLPDEERFGGPPAVILSHALWKDQFGGDPSVLGKSVVMDAKSYTIVGVLPARFQIPDRYGSEYDLWMPFLINEADFRAMWFAMVRVIGRLKPGATLENARAELETILQSTPAKRLKKHVDMQLWHNQIVGGVKPSLLMFLASVGLVLLIGCVNIANLMLARATSREKEIAIRRALGASNSRLLRQMLTESVLLSVLGGTAGMAITFWGKDLLVALIASGLPSMEPIAVNYRVFAFALALSVIVGLGFGLAPALQASKGQLNESLKEGGRGSSEGKTSQRLRSLLVVSEIALAFVLLIGAGLLFKSFLRLSWVDAGFKSDGILSMTIDLTPSKYPKPIDQAEFFERVVERVQSLGGVQLAGLSSCIPLGGNIMTVTGVKVEGRPPDSSDRPERILFAAVSSDYFRTLEIPLRKGRFFIETDVEAAPGVAIVNDSFVRRYFQNEDPLGSRVETPFQRGAFLTIVGVVGDVRQMGPDRQGGPQIYASYLQAGTSFMSIMVRTTGEPMKLASAVRSQIAVIDRDQPPHDLMTLEQRLAKYVAPRRVNMLLLVSFASLALLLAAVGIFGVVSYSVTKRTHEIGIHMALGAEPWDILRMIVGKVLGLTVVGVMIGLTTAFALTRFVSSMLFATTATDPITFAGVSLVMILVAFIASYFPSRRASKTDPLVALRHE